MAMPSIINEMEVQALGARLGTPLRWRRNITVSPKGFTDWVDHRAARTQGEVMIVIPRPGNRILAQTKSFYPMGTYRIPTGGIHEGEAVLEAFRRETEEETGFEVEPVRFLGVVEYTLEAGARTVPFATFVLMTDETSGVPESRDSDEHISEYRDLNTGELEQVARRLEGLSEPWSSWGKFRALPHRQVFEALGWKGK